MLLLALLLIPSATSLQGQQEESSAVRFSGSATLSGDVYVFSSDPANANKPRRPPNLWRLILTPTLTISDYVTLPFNIMFSSRETNVTTPVTGGSSFLQFLQNPMNNLGFLSFSPKFDWAQLYLGTHVPMLSELSSGDSQVFGVGASIRPGKFRLTISAGSMQRAIEPDSIGGVRGAYGRLIYMAKVGVGSDTGSFADLNFVRVRDDPSSIARRPEGLNPEEGVLLTTNIRIAMTEFLFVTGEFGSSIFTRDMGASELPEASKTLNTVILQRVSSRTDFAGNLAINIKQPDWSVKGMARYLGAGYVPLGYPYMQSDRMEFLLSARTQLFENRWSANGSLGHRTNNLSKTKGATATQLIGSVNLFGAITDEFNVSASYANFGVRNNLAQDTLRIETVSQSFSVTPSYAITGADLFHSISATYGLDAYDDLNVVSGAQNSNTTQSILGSYAVAFVHIPVSMSLTVNHLTNDLQVGALTINSLTLGGSYRLMNNTVIPSVSLTYSTNRLGEFSADAQVFYRIGTRWQVTRSLQYNVSLSRNNYRYGSSRPDVSFAETFFQTSLTMQF